MCRLLCLAFVGLVAIAGNHAMQIPEKEPDLQQTSMDDMSAQIRGLQKNVTDLWTYIFELRKAISFHLTHLRQHQIELETMVHKTAHHDSGHSGHDDAHSHDHHGEVHSHTDSDHHHDSHGDDHGHSDHGHGHSESSHDHGHSDSDHGHSDSEHGHSDSGHGHGDDHRHHDHSNEHHSSHEQDSEHAHHGDSHEKHDSKEEQTQQKEVIEKVVAESHVHHHHGYPKPEKPEKSDPLQLFQGEYHHHHHGHSHSWNRTSIPKHGEHSLYDFAICDVLPNRAIAAELQQEVRGQVTLWQKKMGGPLNIHIRLQGFKIGSHHDHQSMQQTMEVENEAPVHEGGHRHGFHIHSSGDLSDGCQSTGPHFNPHNVKHGAPTAAVRHVGDLGNIECDDQGLTNIVFQDSVASLTGQYSILGKSMVIHANADDYGLKADDPESLKTGNAGTRIACCVIEQADKLPLKAYRSMKQATQHKNR